MHPKSLYQKIMVMKEFGPSFCANWNKKKFLHLKLQNKAHKVFGTISSWAQICGAKKLTSISKGRLSFIISRMDRGQKYVQTNSSTVMIQGFKKLPSLFKTSSEEKTFYDTCSHIYV